MNMEKKKKDIKVIAGNGEGLDISPVYDHIKTDTNRVQPKKNIVVPKNSSNKNKKDKNA